MQSKLPDDKILSDLYEKRKLSLAQIGEKYGVTRQRVQQRLSEIGIRGRKVIAITLDRKLLKQLYVNERLSRAAVGKRLGVSESTVGSELRRHGLKRPKILDHVVKAYSRNEIEAVYITEGLFQPEAARRLGMSVPSFRTALRHHGITHRHVGIPFTRAKRP